MCIFQSWQVFWIFVFKHLRLPSSNQSIISTNRITQLAIIETANETNQVMSSNRNCDRRIYLNFHYFFFYYSFYYSSNIYCSYHDLYGLPAEVHHCYERIYYFEIFWADLNNFLDNFHLVSNSLRRYNHDSFSPCSLAIASCNKIRELESATASRCNCYTSRKRSAFPGINSDWNVHRSNCCIRPELESSFFFTETVTVIPKCGCSNVCRTHWR